MLFPGMYSEVIPHCTEQPPQYGSYPLHSTDFIPPLYWTTFNVLNNLHSTEPTLYWVIYWW